jgi:hypothetical protein
MENEEEGERSMEAEASPATVRDFLEYSHDRAKGEYTELLDAWKQIDTKAQGATAIAGIFLAAAFAYAKSPTATFTVLEKCGLALVVLSLVSAVALAAWALMVRPTFGLAASRTAIMATDALDAAAGASSELTRRYIGLLADTVNALGPVNRDLAASVNGKAWRVKAAYVAILCAAGGIVLLTIRVLVTS